MAYVIVNDEPAGAIALFELPGGLMFSLYPRTELAKDAKVPFGPPKSGEFSIGHAVASKAAVDALLSQAEAAGATLTDRAHDRPWGIYSVTMEVPFTGPRRPTHTRRRRVEEFEPIRSRGSHHACRGRCRQRASHR